MFESKEVGNLLKKLASVLFFSKKNEEFETVEPSAEFSFISACLKVAYNSVGTTREKVTQEVAEILECEIESLDFLFTDRPVRGSDDEVFDFPDSERRRAALAARSESLLYAAE